MTALETLEEMVDEGLLSQEQLDEHKKRQKRLKRTLAGAIIYPVVLFLLTATALFVSLYFLLNM